MYNKFSFKNSPDGLVLELLGEAPTYSALAYQADVLRSQTAEISKFSVRDVVLTKFDTITFAIEMVFNPEYLLYTNNLSSLVVATSTPVINPPASLINAPIPPASTTSTPTLKAVEDYPVEPPSSNAEASFVPDSGANSLVNDWTVAPRDTATTSEAVKTTGEQPVLMLLWSKFKFW